MTHPDPKKFFIGRIFDSKTGKTSDQPLLYDPTDLTTHGIITGMTGSGKTGLGIGLLEEAALQKLPAIIIDPKGDLTNLLLHFPELRSQDFQPWIDPELARQQNKSIDVVAQETADRWKTGLANWGLGGDDLKALEGVQYTIYTPGSSSGVAVNILSSFAAPDLPWEDNREVLREKIASTVTALLGLVGYENIDPLRSREHILLSNILESAWSSGRSMELTDLILSVQKPSFDRLGAFPLDQFFPEKDRFDLAMVLNNFLAAPSFQSWLEGQNLDIGSMLYTTANQPCHNIFYLAHLSEAERMFFVTLLFSAIESWMRAQRGTSGLRLLVYFDEIMGYLPPVANPPSRTIILRMLKQARAFGVGLLFATQNPVDLDYKALSNAGTWIIGRLQTEQDKQRLLDGLESAAAGSIDRTQADKMISALGKRIFLYHNVHRPGLQLFETRWALNYLAGPLTRAQIPAVQALTGAAGAPTLQPLPQETVITPPAGAVRAAPQEPVVARPPERARAVKETNNYTTRPPIPSGINEVFWPNELGVSEAVEGLKLGATGELQPEGILYRPALFSQAEVYYVSRKHNLDYKTRLAALVDDAEVRSLRWEDHPWGTIDPRSLNDTPLPNAKFSQLPGWLSDTRRMKEYQADFIDWIYRSGTIKVKANETLKVYAGPDTSTVQFRELCSVAAKKLVEAEQDKIEQAYQRKLDALDSKIRRQTAEVEGQKDELDQRRIEELGTHGELLLSLFGSRKRSISSSLTKRRLTSQAKAELKKDEDELAALGKQMDELEEALKKELDRINDKWAETVNDISEVPITPQRKDIYVENFGIAWQPYYLIRVGDQLREVPAFRPAPM